MLDRRQDRQFGIVEVEQLRDGAVQVLSGFGEPHRLQVSLDQVASPGGKARPFVAMFICNHCPFVIHVRDQLAQLAKDYAGKVGFVAVNPNDVENYPEDRPELMKVEAQKAGYTFPYLYDATQEVAKAYKAAFKVWYHVPWFRGFAWWYVPDQPFFVNGTLSARHIPRPAARKVVKRWYRKPR